MLEAFAIELVNKSEATQSQIGIGIGLAGFITSLVVHSRSKAELQRAPYFAFAALVYLLSSAILYPGLFVQEALSAGILWTVVAAVYVGIGVVGYFFGAIAIARSRDAFGHGRLAILGLIPLLNFVLLLKGSKRTVSPYQIPTIRLLTGGVGIATGFVMLIAGAGLSAWFETLSEEMFKQTDPGLSIESMLRTQGVERTLKVLAANAGPPHVVDEVTTLSSIEADGVRLRRTFVVTADNMVMSDRFRAIIERDICSYEPFVPLLREGASIEEIYNKADGSAIGRHVVNQDQCDR